MSNQATFRAGLLDPNHPTPAGLLDGRGQESTERYAVYRNNVTVSLVEAMKTAFPLVAKVIGNANFEQLAPLYARAHPPSTPLMMFYGAEFPAFLKDFAPLAYLGYLADAALLDLALRRSYHAADIAPFDPAPFQTLSPASLLDATVTLAPATHLLLSDWPLYDIWAFNHAGADKPRGIAQDVLITRPEFDPAPHALPIGAAVWLSELRNGTSFGQAHDSALEQHPDFDLTISLSLALQTGALASIDHKDLK